MSNPTRTRTSLTLVLGVLCVVTFAAACSSSGGTTTSKGTEVTIKDFKFGPDTVRVKVGDTVTFKNGDGQQHTATSDNPGDFDAGAVDPGASKVITLAKAGTFTYHCSFHPFMHGTIEVK